MRADEKGGNQVGSTDERENMGDEREATSADVEAHGITDGPTESLTERGSDETEDFEAHSLIGAPTDAPTEAPTD